MSCAGVVRSGVIAGAILHAQTARSVQKRHANDNSVQNHHANGSGVRNHHANGSGTVKTAARMARDTLIRHASQQKGARQARNLPGPDGDGLTPSPGVTAAT